MRPEPSSAYLTGLQIRALVRVGNIYLPGNAEFLSFEELGCVEHVDGVVAHADAADLRMLRILLTALWFLPRSLLGKIVGLGLRAFHEDFPLAATFRELDYGLNGLVKTLYFSGRKGSTCPEPDPLELMGYSPKVE